MTVTRLLRSVRGQRGLEALPLRIRVDQISDRHDVGGWWVGGEWWCGGGWLWMYVWMVRDVGVVILMMVDGGV